MLRSMGFDCSKENERLLHIYYMLRPSLVFLWVPWAGNPGAFRGLLGFFRAASCGIVGAALRAMMVQNCFDPLLNQVDGTVTIIDHG